MMQLSDKERPSTNPAQKLSADAIRADQVRGLVEQTYDLEEANKAAAKHAKGSSDEYAKAWEKAVGRIDEALRARGKVLFIDSFESFTDSILDGLIRSWRNRNPVHEAPHRRITGAFPGRAEEWNQQLIRLGFPHWPAPATGLRQPKGQRRSSGCWT